MPVMQPPTGPIEITDPNNVPDVLINGPFNVMNTGGMVHITFTNVRPDDGDLFSGKNPPRLRTHLEDWRPTVAHAGHIVVPPLPV